MPWGSQELISGFMSLTETIPRSLLSDVGHTTCMDIRRVYHHTKPTAWLRCKSKEHKLEYKILEANIPNRETAIALEALHAARAIAAEPEIARGGPWAKPTLKAEWKDEIDSASRIRSLLKLQELGDQNREGPLCRHVKDLEFLPAKRGALVSRGAVVRRIRRKSSGTNGNICRRRQRRRWGGKRLQALTPRRELRGERAV